MNKKLLIILLLTFSYNAFAVDKRDLALELLEVTNAEENHELVIKSYVENFTKTPEFNDINFEKMLNETMGWEVIKDPMINIIILNYTKHELKELLKFMKHMPCKFWPVSET